MSEQDIAIVEQTIKGLMIDDNNLRREAEIKLEELMGNKSGLVYCLSSLVLSKKTKKMKNKIRIFLFVLYKYILTTIPKRLVIF